MNVDSQDIVVGVESNPMFEASEFYLDPMDQTDDDLTSVDSSVVTNTPIETEVTPKADNLTDQGDTVTVEESEVTEESQDQDTEENEDSYEDYSQAALFMKYLEDSGLGIYESLDKNLTPQQVAKDIPEFIEQAAQSIVDQKLQVYGKRAELLKLMDDVPEEEVKPLLKLQKFAEFDPTASDVTETQMMEQVKQMYIHKGLSEQESTDLADLSRSKGRLKQDSKTSADYFDNYITTTQEAVKEEYKHRAELDRQQKEAEYQGFVSVLNQGRVGNIKLSREDAANVHDTVWKRDQLVKYTDPNTGKETSEYVSKYELGMYQASKDPNKLAIIAYLISKDFNIEGTFKQEAEKSVNSNILRAIENKDQYRKDTKNTTKLKTGIKSASEFPTRQFSL